MWRPAKSSWLASLLAPLILLSCATDDKVVFEPGVEELTIYPIGLGTSNRSPTLSENARVLAWIQVIGPSDSSRYCALRWERPAPIDTVLSSSAEIESIDLSDDGRHLVGLISQADTVQFFLESEDGASVRTFDVPSDYTAVKTPRWENENRILFGALGPEGRGVWCWNPVDDSITPICVSFPNPLEQWRGTHPDLDQSGTRVCFERHAGDAHIQVTVCSVESGEILVDLDGFVPRFWTIIPTEEEGLLYINSHRSLRGVRLSMNESFYIVQEIDEYDISPDGRWLLTKDTARNLKLRDLRNLR